MSKGPEVGKSLECFQSRKKVGMAEAEGGKT